MPLDAADFIAELSIVDPPGTDPLNQGDDHIRTTKRAVQQSFPNVDAAVPQTAAQMAQMAIKNETNTFTQQQLFAAGSAAAPSLAPSADPTTGIFWSPASFSIAVSGVERFRSSAFGLTAFLQHRAVDGSAGAPGYSFSADQDTGLSRGSGSALNFSVNGSRFFQIAANAIASEAFHTFSTPGIRLFNFSNFIQKTGVTQIAGHTYEDANGIGRWLVGQSTANNSENFTFQRRDAAGAVQDTPLVLDNISGNTVRILNLAMDRRIDTENAVISFRTAGLVVRHTINFEATGGFNPQSLTFSIFNSSGAFLANTLRFGPNGELFMENLPTANPGGSNRLWKSSGFVAIT